MGAAFWPSHKTQPLPARPPMRSASVTLCKSTATGARKAMRWDIGLDNARREGHAAFKRQQLLSSNPYTPERWRPADITYTGRHTEWAHGWNLARNGKEADDA